jgi:hypothetical protein
MKGSIILKLLGAYYGRQQPPRTVRRTSLIHQSFQRILFPKQEGPRKGLDFGDMANFQKQHMCKKEHPIVMVLIALQGDVGFWYIIELKHANWIETYTRLSFLSTTTCQDKKRL